MALYEPSMQTERVHIRYYHYICYHVLTYQYRGSGFIRRVDLYTVHQVRTEDILPWCSRDIYFSTCTNTRPVFQLTHIFFFFVFYSVLLIRTANTCGPSREPQGHGKYRVFRVSMKPLEVPKVVSTRRVNFYNTHLASSIGDSTSVL